MLHLGGWDDNECEMRNVGSFGDCSTRRYRVLQYNSEIISAFNLFELPDLTNFPALHACRRRRRAGARMEMSSAISPPGPAKQSFSSYLNLFFRASKARIMWEMEVVRSRNSLYDCGVGAFQFHGDEMTVSGCIVTNGYRKVDKKGLRIAN